MGEEPADTALLNIADAAGVAAVEMTKSPPAALSGAAKGSFVFASTRLVHIVAFGLVLADDQGGVFFG